MVSIRVRQIGRQMARLIVATCSNTKQSPIIYINVFYSYLNVKIRLNALYESYGARITDLRARTLLKSLILLQYRHIIFVLGSTERVKRELIQEFIKAGRATLIVKLTLDNCNVFV